MAREVICGVYKIISPSQRVYIGQSEDIENRFNTYRNLYPKTKQQVKLWRSFKKYSTENHTFEIIEECPVEDLNCRERYWQDFYDVLNGGLNCILQECGEKRREFSEESLNKLSKSISGENNPFYGKKHTEESKKKISDAKIGTKASEEVKKKMSDSRKGIKRGEEFKNLISVKQKGSGNSMYGRTGKDCPTSKLVIDLQTGIFYYSIKEAAEAYGINYERLLSYLRGVNRNKTNLVYA